VLTSSKRTFVGPKERLIYSPPEASYPHRWSGTRHRWSKPRRRRCNREIASLKASRGPASDGNGDSSNRRRVPSSHYIRI